VKTEVNDYIGDAVPEFALDDYIKEADLEKFTAIINEKGPRQLGSEEVSHSHILVD
jgi:hypothetical protein